MSSASADHAVDQLGRLNEAIPLNPIQISDNPYTNAAGLRQEGYCGVSFESELQYRLDSYPDVEALQQSGAILTHKNACGTCSTLQDLAVYLSQPDLTTPVRHCALLSFSQTLATGCLERLGFSHACAKTWFFNARNTAKHCTSVCIKSWLSGEPRVDEHGELNACLACDETQSGPIFKATAGRTRRNSGIESGIERKPEEIFPVQHVY